MALPVIDPRRGRGVVRTGLIIMLVGLVLGGLAIGYGLVFAGRLAETAAPFPNPGSVSAHLKPGKWALYGLYENGVTKVAYEKQMKVTGPAEVKIRDTFGFYSDPASIVVDGKTYEVFATFDIATEGEYTIDIARRDFDTTDDTTTAMLAPYLDAWSTALWVILGVTIAFLICTPGFITLVVGLFMRRGTKKKLAAVEAGAGPGFGPGAGGGYAGGPGGYGPGPGAPPGYDPGPGHAPAAPAPGEHVPGAPAPTPDPFVAPYDPTAPPGAPGGPAAPGSFGPPA